MTPKDTKDLVAEAKSNAPPHSPNADTAQGDKDSTETTTSTKTKGIIATLTGAAMQLSICASVPAKATVSTKDDDAMDTEKDVGPPNSAYHPPLTQMDITDDSTIGSEMTMDEASLSKTAMIPRPEGATEKSPNKRGGTHGGGVQTRPSLDSGTKEDDSVEEKVKDVKSTVEALMEKRLGEELDSALESLHEVCYTSYVCQLRSWLLSPLGWRTLVLPRTSLFELHSLAVFLPS